MNEIIAALIIAHPHWSSEDVVNSAMKIIDLSQAKKTRGY